jgi:hypothetical protein
VLVPFPPTSDRFLAACPKPEAFTGNPSANPPVPGIPTATIDQVLSACADEAAAVAMSDRYTPPLLMVDEGFEAAVFGIAARRLMGFRGYNPKAGADQEVVEQATRADAYFRACAPGPDGKRITPLFVDSKQNKVQDSIRVTSHRAADSWTHHHGGVSWR